MGHIASETGTCMKCGVHYYQWDIAPDCASIRLAQRYATNPLAKLTQRKNATNAPKE